jgi:hypothetical protein
MSLVPKRATVLFRLRALCHQFFLTIRTAIFLIHYLVRHRPTLTARFLMTHWAAPFTIPITALSTKFTFTRPGTYAGSGFHITFNPVTALVIFTEPPENALTALLAVNVVWVFGLIFRFEKIVNFNAAPWTMGYAVLIPQFRIELFPAVYTPAIRVFHS